MVQKRAWHNLTTAIFIPRRRKRKDQFKREVKSGFVEIMNSADLNIRIGIIDKLSVALSSHTIRDSMFLPDDELPGILLSSQTTTDDSPKTNFQIQSTILIQVVDKKALTVSRYSVDNITNTILQTLIPQNTNDYIAITGFKVCHVALDSLNDSVIQESDGASARKLIRLRFLLYETEIT